MAVTIPGGTRGSDSYVRLILGTYARLTVEACLAMVQLRLRAVGAYVRRGATAGSYGSADVQSTTGL
jgi:hypothetical protein